MTKRTQSAGSGVRSNEALADVSLVLNLLVIPITGLITSG
jgi:hypothetical protein